MFEDRGTQTLLLQPMLRPFRGPLMGLALPWAALSEEGETAGSVGPRRVPEDQPPTPSIFTRPMDSRMSWVVSPAFQRRSACQ